MNDRKPAPPPQGEVSLPRDPVPSHQELVAHVHGLCRQLPGAGPGQLAQQLAVLAGEGLVPVGRPPPEGHRSG